MSNLTLDKNAIEPLKDLPIDNKLLNTLFEKAKTAANLQDFYTVYLWNYCAWDGSEKFSFCSKREAYFAFDPVEVWKLEGSGVEQVFPDELAKGLELYKTVSKWMFIAYLVALITTIVELVVGISALFSRWGSFVTTIVSGVRPPPVLQTPSPDCLQY